MLPKARASLEMGWRQVRPGHRLWQGAQKMPRWAAALDWVEAGRAWFPGQGSKQVGLVANYTGNQRAPKEAWWAELGP